VLDEAIERAAPSERAGLIVQLAARLAMLGAKLSSMPTPMLAAPDENVDVEEGARRLGMSVRYVYRHQASLPIVRIGRRLLLSSRGIDEYIRKRACGHA
jgi:hypothetical protein